jgi:plastocyanin
MVRALVLAVSSIVAFGALPEPVDVQGVTRIGGRPLAEAVVWLDAPGAPRRPAQTTLDQRNLTFSPRVLAVQTGTRVVFPNHDRVFHNVFSHHDGKVFDLGTYPVGAEKEIPFDKPGLSRIFCNIHPQMAAYVMVVDTPYFAVSGEHSNFVIKDVPPGTYEYHAWRPGGSILTETIVVAPRVFLEVAWQ